MAEDAAVEHDDTLTEVAAYAADDVTRDFRIATRDDQGAPRVEVNGSFNTYVRT